MNLSRQTRTLASVCGLFSVVHGTTAVSATPPEACSLLSASEVTKISGDDATISFNNTKVDEKGTTISLCVYSTSRRGPNLAVTLRLHTYKSEAEAREFMTKYGDKKAYGTSFKEERGDVIAPDKVAGLPGVFHSLNGGGEMSTQKGNLVISAGVTRTGADGKRTADREKSRSMLAALLAKL